MQANNKTGIADFWDDVVVFQVPTEDRDLKINDLSPPPQSMRLSCKHLRVLSQKNANGVMQQAMHADGKVLISGQDFAGSADTIDYDEGKDQVILRGTPGNKAVLVKQPVKGGQRDVHEADLIMYWPKTGQIVTDGASKFEGSR